jgi:GntR family transcriptional repressor for pyruvate dehydrogenase complex
MISPANRDKGSPPPYAAEIRPKKSTRHLTSIDSLLYVIFCSGRRNAFILPKNRILTKTALIALARTALGERRYKQIADSIAERIYSGHYRIGERLPTERELAEEFSVGRPVLREALIALELYGLIEVKRSSGIFVSSWQNQPLKVNIFDRGISPFELIDARIIIECEIAAEAAKIITDREIVSLQHLIQKMKDNISDIERYEQDDRDFHILIARAARNTALTAVIESLWALHRRGLLWSQLHRFIPREKLHGDRLDEHLAIYDALKHHDPTSAREAMRIHLARAKDTLMKAASMLQEAPQDDVPGRSARAP